MQPPMGVLPIQKISVSIPSAFSAEATSRSAASVQPCSCGLPFTSITFIRNPSRFVFFFHTTVPRKKQAEPQSRKQPPLSRFEKAAAGRLKTILRQCKTRCHCRGRCPHWFGRRYRLYRNFRRICNFQMGRCGHRPLHSNRNMQYESAEKPSLFAAACCSTSQSVSRQYVMKSRLKRPLPCGSLRRIR